MRLIDADALKKAIPNTYVDIFENCRNCRLLDDEQIKQLIDDAPTIELLKEQEEVEPKRNPLSPTDWLCGKCGMCISRFHDYCPFCGQAVKWE